MYTKPILKYLAITVTFILISGIISSTYAGKEIQNKKLTHSEIHDENLLAIKDNKYQQTGYPAVVNHQSTGKAIFRIDPYYLIQVPGDVQLQFDLGLSFTITDFTGSFYTTTGNLSIEYSTTGQYIDEDVLLFDNCHEILIDITSVYVNGDPIINAALDDYPYVEFILEIETERYYDFDLNNNFGEIAVVGANNNSLGTTNELMIYWQEVAGAEEYELEWGYINDYGISLSDFLEEEDIFFDFRKNSTRITTSNNHYGISLLFDHGYLVYRIRAVGKQLEDVNLLSFGPWSGASSGTLNTFTDKYHITYLSEEVFEGNKNWQFSATYAEEGKKKEVVTFYDGSLRNRQVVTKSSTTNNVIVGEAIYDYQGRPAINVLPVPVTDQQIKYYSNFNQYSEGTPFSWEHFDKDDLESLCTSINNPMLESSGAAKYYSETNDCENDLLKSYIPKSFGFPYSQTEFTADNTGRIRRQGGVGPAFQLGIDGEDRTTKYYYGTPSQDKLNMLFGSEVGYKSYYQKNLAVDPNGQVSVSYIDPKGNLIASALAGNCPTQFEPLPINTYEITEDYLVHNPDKVINNNEYLGNIASLTQKFPISTAGSNNLYYHLIPAQFTDEECLPGICFDCVYDLMVSLKDDDCGIELLNNESWFTSGIGGNGIIDTNCDPVTWENSEELNLDVGSYTLTKNLGLNQEAMYEYLHIYLDENLNTCYPEETPDPNTSDCEITCTSCLESLGEDYTYYKLNICLECLSEEEWDNAVEECNQLCVEDLTSQDAIYSLMLADMSPEGQYGKCYDNESGEFNVEAFPLSIYNDDEDDLHNFLPPRSWNEGIRPDWRKPALYLGGNNPQEYYYDKFDKKSYIPITITQTEEGEVYDPEIVDPLGLGICYVYIDENGSYICDLQNPGTIPAVLPTNLKHVEDFIERFDFENWPRCLVLYHPEYAYYYWHTEKKNYNPNAAGLNSDEFDMAIRKIDTFNDAVNSSFIDINNLNDVYTLLSKDPFWDGEYGAGKDFYGDVVTKSENFTFQKNEDGVVEKTLTIKQTVAFAVQCGTKYHCDVDDNCLDFCDNYPAGDEIKNKQWQMYRDLYLSLKDYYVKKAADAYTEEDQYSEPEGFNGCIGIDNYACDENMNIEQPCNCETYMYYENKIKRFTTTKDIDGIEFEMWEDFDNGLSQMQSIVEPDLFFKYNKCPSQLHLEALLNKLAVIDKLRMPNPVPLRAYPEFSQLLYNQIYPDDNGCYEYKWIKTNDSNEDIVAYFERWEDGVTTSNDCNISLKFPYRDVTNLEDVFYTWENIIRVFNLTYISSSEEGDAFKCSVICEIVVGDITYTDQKVIYGLSNFNLRECVDEHGNYIDPQNEELEIHLSRIDAIVDLMEKVAQDCGLTYQGGPNGTEGYNIDDKIHLAMERGIGDLNRWIFVDKNNFNHADIIPQISRYPYFKIYNNEIPCQAVYLFLERPHEADNEYAHLNNIDSVGPYSYLGKYDLDVVVKTPGGVDFPLFLDYQYSVELYRTGNLCENVYFGEHMLKNCFNDDYQLWSTPLVFDKVAQDADFGRLTSPNSSLDYLIHYYDPFPYNELYYKFHAYRYDPDSYVYIDDDGYTLNCRIFGDIYDPFGDVNGVGVDFTITTVSVNPIDFSNIYGFDISSAVPIGDPVVSFPNQDNYIYSNSFEITAYVYGSYPVTVLIQSDQPPTLTYYPTYPYYSACATTSSNVYVPDCEILYPRNIDICQSDYTEIYNYFFEMEDPDLVAPIDTYIPDEETFCMFDLYHCADDYLSYLEAINSFLVSIESEDDLFLMENPYENPYFYNLMQFYEYADYYPYYINFIELLRDEIFDEGQYTEDSPYFMSLSDFISGEYYHCFVNYDDYVINLPVGEPLTLEDYTDENLCALLPDPICPRLPLYYIFPTAEYQDECPDNITYTASMNAEVNKAKAIQELTLKFLKDYSEQCLMNAQENFNRSFFDEEYHYTLYYYDQSNNLVKTVPPRAVVPANDEGFLDDVDAERENPSGNPQVPSHNFNLATTYRYNSLNQVVIQQTPDGGYSRFWYDDLGRLRFSQNAEQRLDSAFSYTKYDWLGRIIEVGESRQVLEEGGPTILYGPDTYLNDITLPNDDNSQITRTYYDEPTTSAFAPDVQENLRSRVASISIWEDNIIETYQHATHYSYDIHGNVKSLIQGNPYMGAERYKRIDYEYDLVSGNVKQVSYQAGQYDQFYHRYEYDADNRITDVYTSDNGFIWDRDAKYFYYTHGPLARVEIGDEKVQGIDYAYTLQGWLKGVNSNTLDPTRDIGKDGDATAGLHSYFGKDAYGYSLNYFYDNINDLYDYNSSGTTEFLADNSYSGFPLYNGNISSMVTTIQKYDDQSSSIAPEAVLNHYKYDQLNRIRSSSPLFNTNVLTSNNWNGGSGASNPSGALNTEYTYDPNGNLLTLLRNGSEDNPAMDNLDYHYAAYDNRLQNVDDITSVYNDDIDDQEPHNYSYDAIGNLVTDNSENIEEIKWNVYGKIQEIQFSDSKPDLYFKYDGAGNRVSKTTIDDRGDEITTFYLRDAQGNVLTTYDLRTHHPLKISEQMIYGSSRIGLWDRFSQLISYSEPQGESANHTLGLKRYELNNHLGNVLTTVSDWKKNIDDEIFEADIQSAQDYYPFGSLMPGRKYSSNSYRYGFNGMEKDDEITGVTGSHLDFGARVLDSRLGRFLSLDPLAKEFPDNSPYSFAGNNPIYLIDKNGESPFPSIKHMSEAFNAFYNALRSYSTDKGYDYYRSDKEDATSNKTYGSTKISSFKYFDSEFHKIMGANEYRGNVKIKLSNDKILVAEIWFKNHSDKSQNSITKVIEMGGTSAPSTGEGGYYYFMRSANGRLLGTLKFETEEEFREMQNHLEQYEEQGMKQAAQDMDTEHNTGFYTDYYEENFADKESNESTIENVKDAQSGEDLKLEDQ